MSKKQPMPYLKWFLSNRDDIRLNRVTEAARYRYLQVYMEAFKADAGGDVLDPETGEALSVADLAMLFRAGEDSVARDLEALLACGLLKFEHDTWNVVRYMDEQVNQAEYRRSAAERQSARRLIKKEAKKIESKEMEDKDQVEAKEKEINNNSNSNSKVNLIKVKTHKHVTRDSRVTQSDGRIKAKPNTTNSSGISPAQASNLDEPFKPRHDATTQHCLTWRRATGHEPGRALAVAIDDLLNSVSELKIGLKPINTLLEDKIHQVAARKAISDPELYFLGCLKELYPRDPDQDALDFVTRGIRSRLEKKAGDKQVTPADIWPLINPALAEINLRPISYKQFLEFIETDNSKA